MLRGVLCAQRARAARTCTSMSTTESVETMMASTICAAASTCSRCHSSAEFAKKWLSMSQPS